ncbi:hypothetical protein ACFWGM_31925, partial [Streptomyces roseolus]
MARRSTGIAARAFTGRILEAEREGWLGEIEGLQSSLTHAEKKIAQLNAQIARKQEAVDLGIPTFREIRCSHYCGRRTAGAFVTWTDVASGDGQRT